MVLTTIVRANLFIYSMTVIVHLNSDHLLLHQVSVTLTLSTGAAQDIGAVISAIADLLKIAVPPTYEITRSPSPEMFRMSLTRKCNLSFLV